MAFDSPSHVPDHTVAPKIKPGDRLIDRMFFNDKPYHHQMMDTEVGCPEESCLGTLDMAQTFPRVLEIYFRLPTTGSLVFG